MSYLAIQPSAWLREPTQHWNSRHPLWQDAAALCARISPAVYTQDTYWLIDTQAVQRLHGGHALLLQHLVFAGTQLVQCRAAVGCGDTPAQAVARLQLWAAGQPAQHAKQQLNSSALVAIHTPMADQLPIGLLAPWQPHLSTLNALGWHTWCDLRRVPAAKLARRFGQAAVRALAQAYGEAVHGLALLPGSLQFAKRLDLPALASDTAQLFEPAQQLLAQLCTELSTHHMAATVLQWTWHFEPSLQAKSAGLASEQHQRLQASEATAQQPVWWRLTQVHWAQQSLARPVAALSLTLLSHQAQRYAEPDLLASTHAKRADFASSSWTVCLDHIQAKLGNEAVRVMQLHQELAPEHQCTWQTYTPHHAQQLARATARKTKHSAAKSKQQEQQKKVSLEAVFAHQPQCQLGQQPVQQSEQQRHAQQLQSWQDLRPTWLLTPPLRLVVKNHLPHYGGELKLLMGPERLELVAWASLEREQALVRDYYVAWGAQCGPIWVFKTKTSIAQHGDAGAVPSGEWLWYLHGLYG